MWYATKCLGADLEMPQLYSSMPRVACPQRVHLRDLRGTDLERPHEGQQDGRASRVVLATSEVRGLEVQLAVQLVVKPAAQLVVHN
jgi:hypothetical protein